MVFVLTGNWWGIKGTVILAWGSRTHTWSENKLGSDINWWQEIHVGFRGGHGAVNALAVE